MAKGKTLSKKQKGFIKDYIETGNGTESAMRNYKVKNKETANAIAVENLQKPLIKETIARYGDRFSDEELAQHHKKLLNQKQKSYFVFPKSMEDEEIIDKVNKAGFEVIVISPGEKGKYAFYSIDDAVAVKSGLDMAYKIKGTYAPEKKIIEVDEELLEAVKGRVGNILE